DRVFHGPRITNRNACCARVAADCITAHIGPTPGHDELDDRAVLLAREAHDVLAQLLRCRRCEAESATALRQPREVQREEARARMQAGDRLEDAVAVV